jgi:hypothetical protein
MGLELELERGLELFFQSFEANYHSSSSVLCVDPLLLTFKKQL